MSTLQPDYSPQLTDHSSSPASPTPPKRHPKGHHPSSAKSILGIALLSIVIAAGLLYANKFIQDQTSTAPKAALSQTVDLKLEREGTGTINPNDTFTVKVVIDDAGTNNQKVAALDMSFTTQNLEITNFQAGPFFSVTGRHPSTNRNLTAIELKKDIATKRFALGAACDKCCVGGTCTDPNNAQVTYEACSAEATCYAKVADNQVVATLTVKALAAGPASLSFDSTKTQVAVLDNTNNPPQTSAHRNLTPMSLTVGQDDGGLCSTYDFNGQNGIDLLDAVAVIQKIGINAGETGYDAKYDFNGQNGIDLLDAVEIIQLIGTTCE